MKLIINGEEVEVQEGISVTELLGVRKVKMPDMVSVELNGEILDRQVFAVTTLKPGDKVEFLYFMGGGAGRAAIRRPAIPPRRRDRYPVRT